MKLEIRPNLSGLTSYRFATVYPPPPGNRESIGAVLLNRDADLPVGGPDAPALQHTGIVVVGEGRGSEEAIGERPAFTVGRRTQQITIRYPIPVGVGPRPRDCRGAKRSAARDT